MGFLRSLIRILGRKNEEDEESERPNYPYTALHHRSGDDSTRLPKISRFRRFFSRLFQKVRFVCRRSRPTKTAEPVLPIQNPDHVHQTLLIPNADDHELHLHPDNFVVCVEEIAQQNDDRVVEERGKEEEKVKRKSIHVDEGKWINDKFVVCVEETAQQNDNRVVEELGKEEEKVMPKSIHVDEGKWINDNFVVCVEETAQQNDDRVVEERGKEEEKVMLKSIHVDEGKWINDNFVVCVEEIAQQNNDRVVEERGKEEEKVTLKSIHVDEGKWIKHYSSRHRILLVGDGDFSFSAALAMAFGRASNMIATTLDSKAFLKKHYQNAHANMEELRKRSCKVLHGVDATKMANHALLRHLTFDRIIFNFPFAGFFKDLPRESQLKRHRRLVSLFMKNAKEMISENGEIHISHKTNGFHVEWKLEMVAASHRLRLIEAVEFNQLDYPGYNTKCGFGGDNNFNCYPSKTYRFAHKEGVRCYIHS